MRRKPPDPIDELDIVNRALALRRRNKLHTLWADAGRYSISESDPHAGGRIPISLANLKVMVEQIESEDSPRKPMAREGGTKLRETCLLTNKM